MNHRPYYKALNKEALRIIFKIKDSGNPESLYVDSSDTSSLEDNVFESSELSYDFDYVSNEDNMSLNYEEEDYQIIEDTMEGNGSTSDENNPEPQQEPMNTEPVGARYNVYIDPDGIIHILEESPIVVEVTTEGEELEASSTTDQPNNEDIEEMNDENKIINLSSEPEVIDQQPDLESYLHQYGNPVMLNEDNEISPINQQEFDSSEPNQPNESPEVVFENSETGSASVHIESYEYYNGYPMNVRLTNDLAYPRSSGTEADSTTQTNFVYYENLAIDGRNLASGQDFNHVDLPDISSNDMPLDLSKYNQEKFEYYENIDKYRHKVLYRHPKVADILNEPMTSNQAKFEFNHNLDDRAVKNTGDLKFARATTDQPQPGPSFIFRVIPRSKLFERISEDEQQQLVAPHSNQPRVVISDEEDSEASSVSLISNQPQPRIIGRFFYAGMLDDDDDGDDGDDERE